MEIFQSWKHGLFIFTIHEEHQCDLLIKDRFEKLVLDNSEDDDKAWQTQRKTNYVIKRIFLHDSKHTAEENIYCALYRDSWVVSSP